MKNLFKDMIRRSGINLQHLLLISFIVVSGPAIARDAATQSEPEAATGKLERKIVKAKTFMVVAANPYASQAGYEILAKGGSAVDAAIAVQMVLNLVEPQSSGIGGGAFLLHWDAAGQQLKSYDGRETAPFSTKPDRFLVPNGEKMPFKEASFGGLSVGVPGVLRMLELAHKNHGRLPWRDLFAPAINLAEKGFRVSPRLNALSTAEGPDRFGEQARDYFFSPIGDAWPIGHVLKNPAFAETLRVIAENGPDEFYSGLIARDITSKVQNTPIRKGDLSISDLTAYRAKERPPVCVVYRVHEVCGMGPPSSGALTVAQVLKLIEPFALEKKPMTVKDLHLITEAQRLAFADRKIYIADPDFNEVPSGLLDADYLSNRRALIDQSRSMEQANPGKPPYTKKTNYGIDATLENAGTSHVSIIDRSGNVVSMTTTIESAFGSNLMVRGFLLNSELTDFSLRPQDKDGNMIANRIEPGKRPRSSMAPTIVFNKDHKPILILGSPGGPKIILYVLKSLIAHIDWGLDAQHSASLRNFGSRGGPFIIETGAADDEIIAGMEKLGHRIREQEMPSGIHIIEVRPDGIYGGVDPRREGLALGD